jgi:DNA-binding NarL/FixJ family response regulator
MHSSCIRLLIADDHPLFRQGLRRFFELEPGFMVVAEAADGEQAVERCRALQPDVVLLDVNMPRMTGLEALAGLRVAAPHTAAILFTAAIERREVLEAVMLGARGVMLKSADGDELLRCVHRVAAGGYWVEHATINDLVAALHEQAMPPPARPATPAVLTRRESQIVSAILRGASNSEIGLAFGLRDQTVRNYLTRIFHKVGVSTRLELALFAIERGLRDAPAPRATVAAHS